MFCRLTLLIAVAVALASPAAAAARSHDSAAALAQERYYSSYGEPASHPVAPSAASPDTDVWKALAIAGGALVLVLGAAELVTLARLRRATAT